MDITSNGMEMKRYVNMYNHVLPHLERVAVFCISM